MPAKKLKTPAPLSVRDGDVLLLVGTMKGLFLFSSGRARRSWTMSGPFFPGRSVYAAAYDGRNGRLWAAPASMHWGAELAWSDDFGRTWTRPETPLVRFPESAGATLKNIWQIAPGRPDEPDTLYCGVEPSALFESRDGGESWSLNQGLWNHPHREKWMPGGGGLCLHTVLVDPNRPERLTVASSTGGVYRTDDGGASWRARNNGVRAEFMPDGHKHPEFGQCVHKIVQHRTAPGRLYLQNHWGLYRSDDGGDTWRDMANGVPSDFGFCMGIHPENPDTVFIVPLHSDEFRCTPEGKLRVYRTKNGGRSWEAMTRGLPQKDAFETVVRDAMGVDALEPAGVYFGTRSGKLFASRDSATSWQLVHEGLPPVVCARAAVVSRKRAAAKKDRRARLRPRGRSRARRAA